MRSPGCPVAHQTMRGALRRTGWTQTVRAWQPEAVSDGVGCTSYVSRRAINNGHCAGCRFTTSQLPSLPCVIQ